ncbi:hypothetical protein BJ742DRAFT_798121 [Cladochytrium replicatum]|nr:hypothetical protein BJ742DRAFT_798121 [Cladochytrium replicatum]
MLSLLQRTAKANASPVNRNFIPIGWRFSFSAAGCPPGSYLESISENPSSSSIHGVLYDHRLVSCKLCPRDTFSLDFDSKVCTSCLPGSYQNLTGQTSCTVCADLTTPRCVQSLGTLDFTPNNCPYSPLTSHITPLINNYADFTPNERTYSYIITILFALIVIEFCIVNAYVAYKHSKSAKMAQVTQVRLTISNVLAIIGTILDTVQLCTLVYSADITIDASAAEWFEVFRLDASSFVSTRDVGIFVILLMVIWLAYVIIFLFVPLHRLHNSRMLYNILLQPGYLLVLFMGSVGLLPALNTIISLSDCSYFPYGDGVDDRIEILSDCTMKCLTKEHLAISLLGISLLFLFCPANIFVDPVVQELSEDLDLKSSMVFTGSLTAVKTFLSIFRAYSAKSKPVQFLLSQLVIQVLLLIAIPYLKPSPVKWMTNLKIVMTLCPMWTVAVVFAIMYLPGADIIWMTIGFVGYVIILIIFRIKNPGRFFSSKGLEPTSRERAMRLVTALSNHKYRTKGVIPLPDPADSANKELVDLVLTSVQHLELKGELPTEIANEIRSAITAAIELFGSVGGFQMKSVVLEHFTQQLVEAVVSTVNRVEASNSMDPDEDKDERTSVGNSGTDSEDDASAPDAINNTSLAELAARIKSGSHLRLNNLGVVELRNPSRKHSVVKVSNERINVPQERASLHDLRSSIHIPSHNHQRRHSVGIISSPTTLQRRTHIHRSTTLVEQRSGELHSNAVNSPELRLNRARDQNPSHEAHRSSVNSKLPHSRLSGEGDGDSPHKLPSDGEIQAHDILEDDTSEESSINQSHPGMLARKSSFDEDMRRSRDMLMKSLMPAPVEPSLLVSLTSRLLEEQTSDPAPLRKHSMGKNRLRQPSQGED